MSKECDESSGGRGVDRVLSCGCVGSSWIVDGVSDAKSNDVLSMLEADALSSRWSGVYRARSGGMGEEYSDGVEVE